jgi:hypothetical protein
MSLKRSASTLVPIGILVPKDSSARSGVPRAMKIQAKTKAFETLDANPKPFFVFIANQSQRNRETQNPASKWALNVPSRIFI